MTPIDANPKQHLLPPDSEEVIYAKDQPQYIPLPAIRTPDGRVITQWKPDANDLLLLQNGVAVTIVLHTFNGPLQPMQVCVGGIDAR